MNIMKSATAVLLSVFIFSMTGCGSGSGDTGGGSNTGNSIVPEGAIWKSQAIRRDTPPQGFGAIVIWAQTATLKGGQSKSEKAFVTIDYWKIIEETAQGKNPIYEEHYDYNSRKIFNTNEAGLYVRYPIWFDPAAKDYHTEAFNMYAQDSFLYIDVSQTPDNIVHWWMQKRQFVQQGAKYSVEIRLKVEGKASVQLGADYWRDLYVGYNTWDATCQISNNCEAWISDWIGDTGGQFVTVTAPVR